MRQLIYALLLAMVLCVIIISATDRVRCNEKFGNIYNYNRDVYYRYNFRYPNKYYTFCKNCENRSPYNCKNCVNCGLCYSYNGDVTCVPGDRSGPYFREQCQYWEY